MAGQPSLWQRMLAMIDRKYERRIRAASLVTEYGAGHGHGHSDDHHHDADHDDGDAAEIMNLPWGSRRPTFDHTEDAVDKGH